MSVLTEAAPQDGGFRQHLSQQRSLNRNFNLSSATLAKKTELDQQPLYFTKEDIVLSGEHYLVKDDWALGISYPSLI